MSGTSDGDSHEASSELKNLAQSSQEEQREVVQIIHPLVGLGLKALENEAAIAKRRFEFQEFQYKEFLKYDDRDLERQHRREGWRLVISSLVVIGATGIVWQLSTSGHVREAMEIIGAMGLSAAGYMFGHGRGLSRGLKEQTSEISTDESE